MNTVDINWNVDVTGYFNGMPCEVTEEHHIILPHWGKMGFSESRQFIESKEFQALRRVGIEVHSGGYS